MKSEKEKMIAGEFYDPTDQELVDCSHRAKELLRLLNTEGFTDPVCNRKVLEKLMPHSSPGVFIQPPFYCDYGFNIVCGEDVYFNANCVILDVVPVTIGSHVLVGPNVQIYTATHPTDYLERRKGLEYGEPVTIGDDCWIGGSSVICPGVSIGKRCVIAAGAVVTHDIPDDSMAGGVPAKVIKQLRSFHETEERTGEAE